jgi:hypothetical protein
VTLNDGDRPSGFLGSRHWRDGQARLVEGFPNQQEAEAWINNRMQIALRPANASDVG